MAHSVTITTPIPTLEELGESLGLSKARQRSLFSIVRDTNARFRSNGHTAARKNVTATVQRKKKSKRAAAPSR